MTQSTVLKILQRNKEKWLTAKEIAAKLGISNGTITCNLNKLFKQELVYKRIRTKPIGAVTYEWKGR